MLLMSWLKPLTQRIENTFSRKNKRRVNRQSQAAEFKAPRWLASRVEGLEDRALLATFYVDSTPTINGPGADEFTPAAGSHTTVSGLTQGVDLFTTIGGAIAAAAANGTPGDIILVADGTYNEGNNINENLTIRGNQFGVDARSGRSGSNETVISFAGGAFGVHSNNVTLDGLVIQDQTNSNAAPGFGYALYLAPSYTGASIKNNILQNNIVGLALSNTGASQTVIEKNLFQNNTNSGPAGGHSIYSDQFVAGGAVSNVLIDSNKFTNSSTVVASWGLGLSNTAVSPYTNITFSNNEITNHGRGVYLYNTDNSTITGNSITGVTNYAIGLFDGNDAVSVTGNRLQSGNRGLWLGADFGNQNTAVTINQNAIVDSTTASIQLDDGSYTGVLNASANYFGSSVPATVSATFANNDVDTTIDFTPLLDNDESVANQSVVGFQPDLSSITVHTDGAQAGATGRIQEGINTVATGATIKILGGSYAGNVDAATPVKNVNLSPGSSPAQVTIGGDLTLNAGDTLTIELNGTTAGTGYDQFVVNGVVTLGGATLAASRLTSFVPDNGAQFVLIQNDLAEAPGTFAGLAEGATVTLSNIPFTISYLGTDAATGNDVVLTIVTPTSVYVDDSWAGTSVGTTPTNSSPANLVFGYNAFDTIQAAINRVATNGTVTVYGGTYAGTVNVNKNLQPIVAATNSGIPGETTVAINGAVTLDETDNSTTFTQNGSTNLTFGSSITGAGGDETLTVNGSNTLTFSGTVSSLASLVTDALGTTQINTSSITTSGNQSYGDNVVIQVDATLSTGTGAGDITFSGTVNASASGVDLGLTAGSGTIGFTGAVGGSAPTLNSLTINTAGDVTFSSTVATAAGLTQSAGTGTTTFNGASIGGALSVTTNIITLSTSSVTTVSTLTLNAQNAINQNANLDAGASTISLSANQDASGTQSYNQNAGSIQTTSNSATAVQIFVGGTGNANLLAIQTGGSGTVTVNAGGSIVDGNGGSTNITAGTADLTGASGIDLDTAINTLTAASTNSAITIRETNGLAVNTVNAGAATVTLTLAAGAITDNNTTSNNITATSLVASAVTGIDLDTTVTNITADNSGTGNVNIDEANGANVLSATAATGTTTVTSATGNLNVTTVSASTTVTLTATTGSITDANGGTNNVTATSLTATAATGIDLDTTITTLTSANVTGTGAIDISDSASGLVVTSATTNDGNITLNATGGNLTLTTVTAAGTTRDINATTTTSGDILVGNVTATGDTITLNSAGAIEEIGGGDLGSDISARILSLTAVTGIGGLAQIEIDANTNSGDGLTASVTGTGAINLRDVDGVRVNSAVTADGSITLEAASGSLTLTTVTAVGTGATIVANTLAGSGIIDVGVLTASGDSVTLSAFTNITDSNGVSSNVVADSLSASSATGINLDTTITTLTNASVSGTGTIDISDTAGGLTVTSATTANGNVTLNATGGDLTLTTVTASTGGGTGNVTASTTTSGNILVNNVTAAGDNIQLTSAGAIDETGGDGTADLTSGTATLSAATGIGGSGTIEVDFTTLTSATVSGTGAIDLSDLTGGLAVTLATTNDGSITLNATSGALSATTVTAGGTSRDVTLTTTTSGSISIDAITAAGDLVRITSVGAISEIGGGDGTADITSTNAVLRSVTGIGSANAIETAVTNLAFSNTTSGNVQVANTGALTVSSIDGLTTSSNVGTGTTTLSASSPVTFAVNTSSGGTLTAQAIENIAVTTDDITVNASVTVQSTGGSVVFEAGDDISLAAGALVSGSTGATLAAAHGDTDSTGGIAMVNTSAVNAGSGTAILTGRGDITIDVVQTSGLVRITSSHGAVIDVDAGDDTNDNIIAGTAAVRAATGIGTAGGGGIEIQATELAFSNTTSGNVRFTALTSIEVDDVDGLTASNNANGNIIVAAFGSGLTVTADHNITGSGTVELRSLGGGGSGNDVIVNNGTTVRSTGGLVSIDALDEVTLQLGSTVRGSTGVTLLSGFSDNDGDANMTLNGAVVVDSGILRIELDDTGSATQGAAGTITASQLLLVGLASETTNFSLASTAGNDIGTVASSAISAGTVSLRDSNDITVGTVSANNGISTPGSVTINATSGTITVSQAITTTPGTGGGISLSGAVTLNASLTAGAGTITLNGLDNGAADLVINQNLTSDQGMTLTAPRDIIVNAVIQTTGSGSDISLTADNETTPDGSGGVQVTTAGQVLSSDQVTISGSDLFASVGPVDSVEVQADGTNAQVQGAGAISISSGAAAPNAADILINGLINGTGTATVTITADQDVTFAATGDITTNNGFITVTADNATGGNTGGVITMADGTVFTAGTNSTITLSADGSVTLGAINSGSGLVKVTSTSGAILDADASTGVDITAGTAALRAETGVGSDADAIETTFGGAATTLTLAAETDSGDIHVSNSGSFTIGTVDSLVGVTILDTINNNSAADHITLLAASPLTVDSAIANNDGGNITLTASGSTSADDLTLNATVTAAGGNGEIELNAGNDILQNANGDISAAGSGVLDFNAGTGTTDGVITQANGATAVTSTGVITLDADGDITLANVQTGNNTPAAVTINTTAGGVLDGGDTDVDVFAVSGRLTINAAIGIGSAANGLETTVHSLDLDNATSGNIQINQTTAVTVVDAQQATAGNISIVASGTITVDDLTGSPATVISTVGSGTISLDANGNNSDIVLTDGIQSASGNITLTADNDVSAGADGDITSTSGNLQVTADVSSTNVSTIFMNGGALWNAGSGTIDLDSDGSITLGGLSTTNATLTAVTIDSTAGAVADGGNTFVNIVANSGRVVINAATGVGSGDALETTIDSLDVDNATSGNIEINETDAITIFDAQEATAGNILITAGGTITVDNGGAVTNAISTVGAGTIALDANGASSDILLNDGIQSASGSITLTADNDVTTDANGDITSTSGNLSVTADVFAGNNGGVITMADGALWNAGSGLIDLDADGDITLGGLQTTNNTTSAVTIDSTSGGVVDGGDAHVDIVANIGRAVINAVTGVGSADDIETTVGSINVSNTTSGNIDLDETDLISVIRLSNTVANDSNGATGSIQLIADGTILVVVSGDGGLGVSATDGNINIDADTINSDVIVSHTITTTSSGAITISADDSVSFSSAGDVTASGNGGVVVTGNANPSDGNGSDEIVMADGALIDAGSGTITLTTAGANGGRIVLGGLLTTNATTSAVSITSNATVLDGGDSHVDIVANAVGSRVTITAVSNIGNTTGTGANRAIDTTIASLDASVTGAGLIDIDETDAIILFDVDTADGAITVDAGGTITATDVQSTTDSDANDIILDSGADIVVTSIHAGTANGDVLLDAAGSITESTADTTVKITADGLRLVTGTGGVAVEAGTVDDADDANLLDTTVNELEASIASGGLFLVNTQALTLIDQNLLVAGNDGLDRDNDGGTTAITSTSGTVRVNTTAGSLTISELVNAAGQLASFNAVGIFSNGDGNSGGSDVNADQVAFRSTNGVGTTIDAVEINATSGSNGLAFTNSTAGDVVITDVAGGLIIDDVDSLTESDNTTGVVTITALSPLTVAHDVTASGDILMTATDSVGSGDDLTVISLVTVESTGGNVELQAGDDLYLMECSTVSAVSAGKKVTLLGDFGNADPGVDFGSLMRLYGTISSAEQAEVYGNSDPDTIELDPGDTDIDPGPTPGVDAIDLFPADTHFSSSILLDGGEGSDTYIVQFGRLDGGAVAVDVFDSGTGDSDRLTTNGTSAPEEINVFNNVLNGGDLSGGFVDNLTTVETVNYNGNVEFLTVHGQNGNEFFHVRPSQTTRITINGGNTNFGPGLTPNTFVPGVEGDVLDLQTLDNTLNFIGTTFFVDGGAPQDFKGVSIRNLENVPLIPLPTETPTPPATTTWKFDFDSTTLQTQAGYTSVAPGRLYGTGTLTADFGWVSVAAGHNDRGDGLSSVFENALQDFHFANEARVFRTDVPNGWYLVSLKSGDTNASMDDLEVRNGDTQYLLLDGLNSAAGEFGVANFVIQVFDGTLDLKFESGSGGTQWNINSLEIQPGKILTIGSPDPGVLAADGLTIENYTGYESVVGSLVDGTLVTITPGIDTNGDDIPDAFLEVTSPDADPNLEGVQSIVSGGQWTYSFRRPNVSGSAFVAFEAVLPNAVTQTGSLAIDFVAPSIRRYDFNASGSPTQTPIATVLDPTGYVGILPSDLKLPTNGYGWVSSPAAFDRGSGIGASQADLLRDGAAGTSTGVFQTTVTPGTYLVNVTLGDRHAARDNMIVRANGNTMLPDVDTLSGQFFHSTFSVTVGGSGLLTLEFLDAGGDPTWVANGVEIRGASQVNAATFSSPLGGVTADGSTIDTITVNLASVLTANTLFTLSSSLGTIVSADASSDYQGTQVLAMSGSSSFTFQLQRPSSVGTPTFTATAIDGSAFGTGADTTGAALNYTAPAFRRFDFNAAGSPTQTPSNPPSANGYQAVTTTDLYSGAQGYGWVGTAPAAFDRGSIAGSTYSDLLRDGHSATVARQFRIDSLGTATYSVTVTMGDKNAAHDAMSVSILTGIGTGVTGVSNTLGQFTQQTFTATPVGGTLVFEFSDLGGSDPSWVVNAIELNSTVATITVPTTSPGTADGTTVDSFNVTGLVAGQVYTVSTTLGTLVQNSGGGTFVDADSAFSGNQILATAGSATLFIKRPSGAGTSTFTVTQVTGGSTGTGTLTYTAPASLRFDFNGGTNNTAAGFTPVRGSTLYTAGTGYGFVTAASDLSRGGSGYSKSTVALYEDFATGTLASGGRTFQVTVTSSATLYDVRVYTGDRSAARNNLRVRIEGQTSAQYSKIQSSTAANVFTSLLFTGVQDLNGNGKLDIEFRDVGNAAGFADGWAVNGVDIALAGTLPVAAPQALPGMTFDANGMESASQALLDSFVQSGETLTDERLSTVVADAIARWSSLSLTDEQLARLQGVNAQIADLDSQGQLGLAGSGHILIDNDALGLGWHIGDGPVPAGQVDLLSVVLHELGHIAGYSDLDPQLFANSLMAGELQAGQQRGLSGFDLATGTNGPAAGLAAAPLDVDTAVEAAGNPNSVGLLSGSSGTSALSVGSASEVLVADKTETVDTPVIVHERKRVADYDAVFAEFGLVFDDLETV